MLNNGFSSIIELGEVTVGRFLLCSLVSIVLGLCIALVSALIGKKSRSVSVSLTLIPFIVQVLIMIVNGNIGVGLGVAGAFSLVRYRSNPGTASDILVLFIAMTVGITMGVGYMWLAILFTVIALCAYVLISLSGLGGGKHGEKELKITIPESLNYPHMFDDIFKKYTKGAKLTRVRTVNLGSMYQLCYNIILTDDTKEKEMIDEIRCRNGNLDIVCGMIPETAEYERL